MLVWACTWVTYIQLAWLTDSALFNIMTGQQHSLHDVVDALELMALEVRAE